MYSMCVVSLIVPCLGLHVAAMEFATGGGVVYTLVHVLRSDRTTPAWILSSKLHTVITCTCKCMK